MIKVQSIQDRPLILTIQRIIRQSYTFAYLKRRLIYMDVYIKNYELFDKIVVYDFKLGDGGLGDNIKFFMFVLESCMKKKERLYYKKNNIDIENYIKLKHSKMYVDNEMLQHLQNVKIVVPQMFYSSIDYNYSININQVFYFTDEVIINSKLLFPNDVTDYLSIHVRLGDKYLETEMKYVLCKEDVRTFSEEKIHNFIEKNYSKNILLCCDNNSYKVKLKEKYKNIIITNCDIGHSSLFNTTTKQILDAVTEFYILTNSSIIFSASNSGFSRIASKFNNIPLII